MRETLFTKLETLCNDTHAAAVAVTAAAAVAADAAALLRVAVESWKRGRRMLNRFRFLSLTNQCRLKLGLN